MPKNVKVYYVQSRHLHDAPRPNDDAQVVLRADAECPATVGGDNLLVQGADGIWHQQGDHYCRKEMAE